MCLHNGTTIIQAKNYNADTGRGEAMTLRLESASNKWKVVCAN